MEGTWSRVEAPSEGKGINGKGELTPVQVGFGHGDRPRLNRNGARERLGTGDWPRKRAADLPLEKGISPSEVPHQRKTGKRENKMADG